MDHASKSRFVYFTLAWRIDSTQLAIASSTGSVTAERRVKRAVEAYRSALGTYKP